MSLEAGIKKLFLYSFRHDAHQLLAWGHADIKGGLTDQDEEEDITGDLTKAIEQRLSSAEIPERFSRYDIHNEMPVNSSEKRGKRRRRLDLVVRSTVGRRPTYIFEAKRLKTNGFSIGKYIGEDGVQCFVKGVYAADEPEAGMVAFIQDKDDDYWLKQLEAKLPERLTQVKIVPELESTWESEHERPDGSMIKLIHTFLDCTES